MFKELCKLATQMQLATRANFYRAFYQEGGFTKGGGVLFDVLADVLGDPKSTVVERQAACEILSFFVYNMILQHYVNIFVYMVNIQAQTGRKYGIS